MIKNHHLRGNLHLLLLYSSYFPLPIESEQRIYWEAREKRTETNLGSVKEKKRS